MTSLSELLKRRGATRVVYCHADHFEPWRDGIKPSHCDEVAVFAEQMDALPYANRLSLFYRAHVPYGVLTPAQPSDPDNRVSRPDDPILFRARKREEVGIARRTMTSLLDGRSHEVQVHIHHEGFTLSDKLYPVVREALEPMTTPQRDGERFELALQLALKAIREETGQDMARWAFVHGNWALGASDPEICRIENELEILVRNGCYADFTFPAGRSRCNPKNFDRPFAVSPAVGTRAFEREEAEAVPVDARSNTLTSGRLFIWNSPLLHPYCSLDDYSEKNSSQVYGDPAGTVEKWLSLSPMLDDTIYVKTHAHSMYKAYWDEGGDRIAPLARPGCRRLLELLMETCEQAGAEFKTATASEVYADWRGHDQRRQKTLVSRLTDPFKENSRPAAAPPPQRARAPEIGAPRPEDTYLPDERRPERTDLNRILTEAFAGRVEALGEAGSGAYGYYAARIAQDDVLLAREWDLANRLHDLAPGATLHEIGCGAATFAIACAALGHRCVAVERDRKRAETAAALAQACSKLDPGIADRVRVLNVVYPTGLLGQLPERWAGSIIAATNFISSIPESEEPEMIEALGRYDMALIDLYSFRIRRNEEAERAELAERVLEAGFTEQVAVMDGNGFEYVLFR